MRILGSSAVASAVLAAALALVGCGGPDAATPQVPGTVATVLPSADPATAAPAAPTAPTPVDQDDRSPQVETSASTGSDLPGGFPVEEIPIVGGTVERSSRGKAGGPYAYTVIVRVAGTSATTVMAGITAQLTGAGFAAEAGPGTDTISASTFRNARYEVNVNVVRAKATTTVTYVVVRTS